jgi:hypothetical protein
MEMKKGLATAGIVAACAVCCAPLLLPVLSGMGLAAAGTAGAGALFGLPADVVICGGIAAAALVWVAAWGRQQRRKDAAEKACAGEPGCSTAGSSPTSKQ